MCLGILVYVRAHRLHKSRRGRDSLRHDITNIAWHDLTRGLLLRVGTRIRLDVRLEYMFLYLG